MFDLTNDSLIRAIVLVHVSGALALSTICFIWWVFADTAVNRTSRDLALAIISCGVWPAMVLVFLFRPQAQAIWGLTRWAKRRQVVESRTVEPPENPYIQNCTARPAGRERVVLQPTATSP